VSVPTGARTSSFEFLIKAMDFPISRSFSISIDNSVVFPEPEYPDIEKTRVFAMQSLFLLFFFYFAFSDTL
jgi:hypothetical protein